MLVKQGMPEDVWGMVLQRLSDKVKTGLFEPQCPEVQGTLVGSTSAHRRLREPRIPVTSAAHPARGTMENDSIEGHEWGA